MRPTKDHLFYMVTFNVNRRPIIFRSFTNAINYAEKNKQYVSGFYESQWFLMHDRLQRKYMKGKYNFLRDLKTNCCIGDGFNDYEYGDYCLSLCTETSKNMLKTHKKRLKMCL